jgi:XTP/dITP diphosphohydrolase
MPTEVLLATRNPHKLAELRRILADVQPDLRVIGLDDAGPYEEVPETAATFADNALTKARVGALATGLITVADDSGLAVDALNGMPGVLSARWSGRHGDDAANLRLLLDQIVDVPDGRRGAAFVCAAALATPSGGQVVVEGQMPGRLVRQPRGHNGFGYDPIFVADGKTLTNGELPPAEKDAISHRGKAMRAIAPHIVRATESLSR